MAEKLEPGTALTPNAACLKMTVGLLLSTVLIAVILFVSAGRIDWLLAWIFLLVWGFPKLVFVFLLRWHDPALMVERMTRHENTQSYDRWILPAYYVVTFGTILLAGLDAGRFGWSRHVPLGLIILSYVINLLGNVLASWAVASNPFFSSESRLQTDRGQHVASRGPYRFVRHPAYLAAVMLWPLAGLMLGSWWALLLGFPAALLMFIRTACEDRMLQSELPGYAEYARQVRYRLFPGIW